MSVQSCCPGVSLIRRGCALGKAFLQACPAAAVLAAAGMHSALGAPLAISAAATGFNIRQFRSHLQLYYRINGTGGMHRILSVRRTLPCAHPILDGRLHSAQSEAHLVEKIILRVGVRCCIRPLLMPAAILSSARHVVMISSSLQASSSLRYLVTVLGLEILRVVIRTSACALCRDGLHRPSHRVHLHSLQGAASVLPSHLWEIWHEALAAGQDWRLEMGRRHPVKLISILGVSCPVGPFWAGRAGGDTWREGSAESSRMPSAVSAFVSGQDGQWAGWAGGNTWREGSAESSKMPSAVSAVYKGRLGRRRHLARGLCGVQQDAVVIVTLRPPAVVLRVRVEVRGLRAGGCRKVGLLLLCRVVGRGRHGGRRKAGRSRDVCTRPAVLQENSCARSRFVAVFL